MDTQQILTSLANLRENLSAIESARQQVLSNVAAYDRVQQQLADTSTNISKILKDFTAISKAVETHEKSVESYLDAKQKEIFKGLKDKANAIAKESSLMVESLRTTLASLKSELSNATEEAIKQINDNSTLSNNDLSVRLKKIHDRFSKTLESTIDSFQKETGKYCSELSKISDKFDAVLSSQLSRLATAINNHISKYESMEHELSSEIDNLKSQNAILGRNVSTIEKIIERKLDELLPQISYLFDEIKGLTSDIRGDIRTRSADLTTSVKGVETSLLQDAKKNQESIRKQIEKHDEKSTNEIEALRNIFQGQIVELEARTKRNLTVTVVCFILLALPLGLIFFKVFRII